ncbi:hypothetical protein JOM56_008849 [Amanita muscaria]
MDSLTFDSYASYSDSSAPRTPSPRDDIHFPTFKHVDPPMRHIFDNHDEAVVWSHHNPAPNYEFNPSGGSLLHDIYEHDLPEQPHHPHQPAFDPWSQVPHTRPQEYQPTRRATYPFARHDQAHGLPLQYPPFMPSQDGPAMHTHYSSPDTFYAEHLSINTNATQLRPEPLAPSMNSSPHSGFRDYAEAGHIKLEDGANASMLVASQTAFYRTMNSPTCHTLGVSYLPTGHPVHHTDDAASKETQYLRRRCFNCHTTEPPSWRRSTLNPGKIVCNKCGLYERTHLRPRPLRFDELRAGNKARKQSKGAVSPKTKTTIVKKEPREYNAITRRDSVSSSASAQSSSSDWDDSVSVYSSGSGPTTSFSSPSANTFPLSRDSSQSPPRDGGIRLPNAPLTDIASLQSQTASQPLASPEASSCPAPTAVVS